jgi:7-cyano-7-deazaguanine tRNA-ribosyltransferase
MAKRDFAVHALGSPTPVMQQYGFDTLVDMVMAAKVNLPPDRPLHLFGAGHPMMFAMSVAMGCDIFDSASYALFARNERYMTVQGTARMEDLEYFPCDCPTCHGMSPEKVKGMIPMDRERFLASHNLHACFGELQTIKQAIVDGRLWELVEARSHSHPALQRAFQRMLHYAHLFESGTPVRKKKGPLITTHYSLSRPEVLRHQQRLMKRYNPPSQTNTILLLPESYLKPFRENIQLDKSLRRIEKKHELHTCAYNLPFAIIPQELLDVFPLSQSVDALQPTTMTLKSATARILSYLKTSPYKRCLMVVENKWQSRIAKSLKEKLKPKMAIKIIQSQKNSEDPLSMVASSLKPRRHRHRMS